MKFVLASVFGLVVSAALLFSCGADKSENGISYDGRNKANNASKNQLSFEYEPIVFEQAATPSEFVAYIKTAEHLNKTKTIGDVQYQITHLPKEYMASNEIRDDNVAQSVFDSIRNTYDGVEYYMIKIEVPGAGMELAKINLSYQAEYEERIKYLSFDMQNNLKAITDDSSEINCTVYHFERTYNITPYSTFLIGFPDEKLKSSKFRTVVLNDNLFNNGLIKFKLSLDQLLNTPILKFQK